MRTARWLPSLVLFLALLAAASFSWPLDFCDDWPTAMAHHQLGVEVQLGRVDAQVQRIRLACEEHREFACTVMAKAVAADSGSTKGKLSLRLSPGSVEPLSRIAATDARITGQITRQQDLEQAAALPDWIAVMAANRARIDALLARNDLTEEQRGTLNRELVSVDGQMSRLTAAKNELRPRVDTDTLYIEVTAAR